MEWSLPDMPFGMGGRRARAAANPRALAVIATANSLLTSLGPPPAASTIEGAASAQRTRGSPIKAVVRMGAEVFGCGRLVAGIDFLAASGFKNVGPGNPDVSS